MNIWDEYPDKPNFSKPLLQQTMHKEEVEYLYEISKRLGSGNYANLGVWKGLSTAALAAGIKDSKNSGKVYAVDLYPYPPETIINNFIEVGLEKYLEVCKGSTTEWAKKLSNLE